MARESKVPQTPEEIEAAWHDLGNGTKAKAKLEARMKEKLDDLVAAARSGNWRQQFEQAIVQMITYNYSSKDTLLWYGHLVTQCQIKRDLTLPSPAGVRFMFNKYELFINPLMFGLYSTEEQIAILKHEMLHIINLHIFRQKDREHKKWNYGTDIAINQLISNIPEDGLQPEKFGLERNLNAEQYYDMIPTKYDTKPEEKDGQGQGQKSKSKGNCSSGQCSGSGESDGDGEEDSDGNGGEQSDNDVIDNEQKLKDLIASALQQAQNGMIGDHSRWGDSEGDEEAAKEITRQMTETATQKSRGLVPGEAQNALTMLKMKEQVNWKKELRRIVGNRKAFQKLTIKKNDRRFPDRKDLRGKTRDHVADILVVLDVSGSVSDEELLYGLNEVRAISEKAGAGIKIIQVDAEPKVVSDFDPRSKSFSRRGYGGTYLYPAIEMAVKEKMRFNAVIMITDGYIERSWDGVVPKVPFIWLVTQDKNNLSFDTSPYARMKVHTLEIGKK